ncbi:hypothetical protein FJZ36_18095 [Candidatus Poribacteria bacterium]|nr:hypothetical protein [Candidatus Poribacteria bacterium]
MRIMRWCLLIVSCLISIAPPAYAQKKGVLRISGDNAWAAYVDGTKVAEGNNWQAPTVTNFDLVAGRATISVFVHDAEPAAAGKGGFLADIILDNKTYIGTGDPGWICDKSFNKPDRKDGWEKPNFDDKKWEEPVKYEQFGAGIWGFGAAAMRAFLKDPDCTALWVWCGPNDGADDIYFRYRIGTLAVEPKGKLATVWAAAKTKG